MLNQCTVTEPTGETRPYSCGSEWWSLAYLDPFQRAHDPKGRNFRLTSTANTLRIVTSPE